MMNVVFIFLPTVAAIATDPTIDQNPNDKQGWYSAPNYRSTLEIVWPCFLTIFLCCWNAIHPDLPHPKLTWLQRFLERTTCLILGAVAPEIFVYFAYRERSWVTSECADMATISGGSWSTTHGFYAQMGGFAVELVPEDGSVCDVRYIDVKLIRYLFRKGQLSPYAWITKEEIQDKGKADGLVKSLAILQLLWLLVQCSARLAQHLPITTLELSTLAYIPCAIFVYYLWWDKPYEVNVPTYLRLAPEGTYITDDETSPPLVSVNLSHGITGSPDSNEDVELGRNSSSLHLPISLKSDAISMKSRVDYPEAHVASHTSEVSPERLHAYRSYETLRQCQENMNQSESYCQGYTIAAVFFVVGAVHLSAWNFSFPTTYERVAWRISSIVITFNIPILWLANRILDGPHGTQARKPSAFTQDESSRSNTKSAVGRLPREFWYIFFVPYAIARLYLMVEVFVALRAAPKGVYRIPEWTNFLPHIG